MAKKKAATKKTAAKKKPALGKVDETADQGQLTGFEEDRIPDLEAVLSTIAKNERRIKALQMQNAELRDKDGADLLHQHNLPSYGGSGLVLEIVAGEERVVVKKAPRAKKPKPAEAAT